jgi:hypothetical protein
MVVPEPSDRDYVARVKFEIAVARQRSLEAMTMSLDDERRTERAERAEGIALEPEPRAEPLGNRSCRPPHEEL